VAGRLAPWLRREDTGKYTSCIKERLSYRSNFLSNLYLKMVIKSFFAPISLGFKTCVSRNLEKAEISSSSGYLLCEIMYEASSRNVVKKPR
jgi:hypothetical protein